MYFNIYCDVVNVLENQLKRWMEFLYGVGAAPKTPGGSNSARGPGIGCSSCPRPQNFRGVPEFDAGRTRRGLVSAQWTLAPDMTEWCLEAPRGPKVGPDLDACCTCKGLMSTWPTLAPKVFLILRCPMGLLLGGPKGGLGAYQLWRYRARPETNFQNLLRRPR